LRLVPFPCSPFGHNSHPRFCLPLSLQVFSPADSLTELCRRRLGRNDLPAPSLGLSPIPSFSPPSSLLPFVAPLWSSYRICRFLPVLSLTPVMSLTGIASPLLPLHCFGVSGHFCAFFFRSRVTSDFFFLPAVVRPCHFLPTLHVSPLHRVTSSTSFPSCLACPRPGCGLFLSLCPLSPPCPYCNGSPLSSSLRSPLSLLFLVPLSRCPSFASRFFQLQGYIPFLTKATTEELRQANGRGRIRRHPTVTFLARLVLGCCSLARPGHGVAVFRAHTLTFSLATLLPLAALPLQTSALEYKELPS